MNWKFLGVLVVSATIVGLLALTVQADQEHRTRACKERWAEAGYAARWKDGWGCQVEFEPGRWIDQDRIRVELKGKQ